MNKFTIRYPNGIKRHVKRLEIELLASSLTQTGPHEYFASSLQNELAEIKSPRFYAGQFIIVAPDGKKKNERLESARAMIERLSGQGLVAA